MHAATMGAVGSAVDLRRDVLGRPAALTFEVLSLSGQPTGGNRLARRSRDGCGSDPKKKTPDPDDFRQDLHEPGNRLAEQHLQGSGPELTRSAREAGRALLGLQRHPVATSVPHPDRRVGLSEIS
jgi:hypothetical protein